MSYPEVKPKIDEVKIVFSIINKTCHPIERGVKKINSSFYSYIATE